MSKLKKMSDTITNVKIKITFTALLGKDNHEKLLTNALLTLIDNIFIFEKIDYLQRLI